MSDQVQDKSGNATVEGDGVFTKIRGGKREGEVNKVVRSEEEAKEGVKNAPEVLLSEQHGHRVAHNPENLDNMDKQEK